jgi:flagellin-specific chaperone FliS
MGQTDKQFGGFLRMLIARMKKAIEASKAGNQQEALELMQDIMTDLQNTLED